MNIDLERFDKVDMSEKTEKTKNIHRTVKSKGKKERKNIVHVPLGNHILTLPSFQGLLRVCKSRKAVGCWR